MSNQTFSLPAYIESDSFIKKKNYNRSVYEISIHNFLSRSWENDSPYLYKILKISVYYIVYSQFM